MEVAMTLDEIAGKAQDELLNVMQTIKVLKEEVLSLNQKNAELQQQLDVPNLTETLDE